MALRVYPPVFQKGSPITVTVDPRECGFGNRISDITYCRRQAGKQIWANKLHSQRLLRGGRCRQKDMGKGDHVWLAKWLGTSVTPASEAALSATLN